MEQSPSTPRPTDEYDIPLGELPQAGWMQLTRRGHIEGATAEIRVLGEGNALPQDTASQVWQHVGGSATYPVFEPATMQAHNVTITPDGAQSSMETANGWQLRTADFSTSVVLFPSMIAVQTRDYPGYSEGLARRLQPVLEAFGHATGAPLVTRIGLRYINRLTDPDAQTPAFWRGRVRSAFAGALGDDYLADRVAAVHQQLELRLTDVAGARVISGAIEHDDTAAGRYGFLIDIDVFREDATAFDASLIGNLTRQLNRTALSVFTRVITDDTQTTLGPVRRSEKEEA